MLMLFLYFFPIAYMLKCVAQLAISLVWKNVKNVVFGSSLGILSFSLLLEFLQKLCFWSELYLASIRIRALMSCRLTWRQRWYFDEDQHHINTSVYVAIKGGRHALLQLPTLHIDVLSLQGHISQHLSF